MIGSNIKAIREFKRVSIETIVRRLGLFTKKYLDIEKNLVKVDDLTLKKIANILDVGYQDIINFNINEFNLKQKELDYRNIESIEESKIDSNINKPIIKPILLTPSDVLKKDLSNQLYVENSFNAKDDTDPFNFLVETKDKTFSPRLLNKIEPYFIDGVAKSLFYSEFNTGLKKGDRVFIINGVYDSYTLIKSNKYKRGRDGYKVLFVDQCKIVLDIYYTGLNPWKQEDINIGYSINLYYVKNYDDFKLVNRQISTSSGIVDNKFNYNNHNFIYVDKDYDLVSGWGLNSGLKGAPGFFVRNGINGWKNVTNEFLLGNLNSVISPDIDFNGRIKIADGEFTYILPNGEELFFEEGKTYKFDVIDTVDETYPRWILDIDYNRVFITKANFRKGEFKGRFNSGLYGNSDTTIKWSSPPAKWNTGTLYNTYWEKGEFNSIYTLKESYYSEIDPKGNPIQKINGYNNNGRGYSLIVDSLVDNMIINNATIINTKFGESATYSVVYDFTNNIQTEFNTTINRGYFIECDFVNSNINNSLIVDSNTVNSKLTNVKAVSSQHSDVVIDNSSILNKNSISVIGYDEYNLSVDNLFNDVTHKVYKFYINELEFNKLKFGDYFYLSNFNNNQLTNFFDKKFKVSSWVEYVDFFSGDLPNLPNNLPNNTFYKRGINMAVFLSTPLDNLKLYNSYRISPLQVKTNVLGNNPNKLFSIDIVVSTYDIDNIKISSSDKFKNLNLDFNVERKISSISDPTMPKTISFTIDHNNIFISKGDIESGIINNTDWNSGNHIQSNNDMCITPLSNEGGTVNITLNSSKKLEVNLNRNINNLEIERDIVKLNDIVYLNSIYYKIDSNYTRLGDTYRVINITDQILTLEEISSNILPGLPIGGIFTTKLENRYNYVHLTKITNSNIKEGLFDRSYLTNNNIFNKNLNIEDKDFTNISNIKKLTLINTLFDNNNNKLNKAIYINSHINTGNDHWINGILFESIWNSSSFNGGLFKKSLWLNGIFNNGLIYQSNSFNAKPTTLIPSINTNQIYSYYRKGETSIQPNNKYTWTNGTFNNGIFEMSDFENGTFNNGLFYHSNFYNGIINNGFFGSKNLSYDQTNIFNGTIQYCNIINANVVAKDTSLSTNQPKNILWKNGLFESGVFGNDSISSAIWENGIFNGGEFTNTAKWKNGTFNNGKFTSNYGSTLFNTTNKINYTWEEGIFNGGVFGNANLSENSLWFNGEFNGGKFIGKVWNNGILTGGEFLGSATYSATISVDSTIDNKLTEAQSFVDSFKTNFYGLWRNGIVSSEKDRLVKDKEVSNTNSTQITFKNMLWQNGIFSYLKANFENSIWLNGKFEKGIFYKSSFNPFVKRLNSPNYTFEESNNCIWENGNFKESDFYYSEWKDGLYQVGNSYGMIWNNGVNEYMNAFNIWWKDGIWRNGNWYGSFINYNGILQETNEDTPQNRKILFDKKLLKRIASKKQSDSYHIWNIFEDLGIQKEISSGTASAIIDAEDVVIETTTYYPLKSCIVDNITYYTNIEPVLNNQRYRKTSNNNFYTYDSSKQNLTLISIPNNFISDLVLIPNTTGCPVNNTITYYQLRSCDNNDTTIYYTDVTPPSPLQRFIRIVNSQLVYYFYNNVFQTLSSAPSTLINVTIESGQVGCPPISNAECWILYSVPFGGCTIQYKNENGTIVNLTIPSEDEGLCYPICATEIISDPCGFVSLGSIGCINCNCN
jgi:transcriptional regulator with XRE-family HTH domain